MTGIYKGNDIQGWMSAEELNWLYENAKKMDSIVEIGSWKGRSTHALLSACKGKVVAVDHFKGSPSAPSTVREAVDGAVFSQFMANVGMFPNLEVKQMSSTEAVKDFEDDSVDMVFIDGNHTYEEVKNDIKMWKSKAKKILCGHDYDFPEVKRAVDEMLSGINLCGSIWFKKISMEKDVNYWNDRYSSGRDSGHGTKNPNEVFVRLSNLSVLEGVNSILDVGCGDCKLLPEIQKIFPNATYLGIDPSGFIIRQNQKRFENNRTKFEVLKDCSFDYRADLVICFDVLFHITNDYDYKEFVESLKKSWNKYLLVITYNDNAVVDPNRNDYIKVRRFNPLEFSDIYTEVVINIDNKLKSLYIFKKL